MVQFNFFSGFRLKACRNDEGGLDNLETPYQLYHRQSLLMSLKGRKLKNVDNNEHGGSIFFKENVNYPKK